MRKNYFIRVRINNWFMLIFCTLGIFALSCVVYYRLSYHYYTETAQWFVTITEKTAYFTTLLLPYASL